MQGRVGRLHVIAGCMSSGKTGELIRLLSRHAVTGDTIVVYKHSVDSRDGCKARSRLGTEMEAVVVGDSAGIADVEAHVVAIEEGQFFDEGLVPVVRRLLHDGHLVYVTGLAQDFRGEPFGIMPTMLALADEVSLLTAICQKCHGVGTRTQRIIDGEPAPWAYPHVIAGLWSKTETLVRQPLLVLIVWGHLVVGVHYWLRLRPAYRRFLPVTYLVAAILPLVALLGFWGAGVELRRTATAAERALADTYDGSGSPNRPPPDEASTVERKAALGERKELALAIAGGLLAIVLLARVARRSLRVRRGTYRIIHANGRVVVAPVGQSLLEALREARIPHASVCGGRARCTTCRVRIGRGLNALPAPNPEEVSALRRIHADADTRLACQLRPRHAVHVTPLLPADAGAADANVAGKGGSERALAVMFVDLRDSSRLAEHRLPYDVLFILNRFFAEMADALSETGGYYSTFNGDGFMALYGTTSDLAQGCRDALHGAVAVSRRLAQINAALISELRDPLRVGISIHAGEAIVGTMGPPANPIVSALGDTVNVAARLEAETKRHNCALIVSAACATASGIDFSQFPEHTVDVRGRSQQVSYYAVADAAAIAALMGTPKD